MALMQIVMILQNPCKNHVLDLAILGYSDQTLVIENGVNYNGLCLCCPFHQ